MRGLVRHARALAAMLESGMPGPIRRPTRLPVGLLLVAVGLVAPTTVAAQGTDSPPFLVYVVDRAASQLYIVVHRAGLLSFLGHEHAIVPAEWSADLCLSDPVRQGAHARLTVQTASLVIDSDSARALAGMGGGPGDDDRRTIQARMLDSTNLAAKRYPEVRLDLQSAEENEDERHVAVRGSISLRGHSRDVDLPVDVERRDDGELLLTGSLRIHMRDFDMEPESRAGLVKVSNDVDLHFALAVTPTSETCRPEAASDETR